MLGRDSLGVKPLFYAMWDNQLIFVGSEPKALLAHPDVKPEADLDSLREIFGLGPARNHGCGVFRWVYEVKPGCLMVYSDQVLQKQVYWSRQAAPSPHRPL